MHVSEPSKKRGRPVAFDYETALAQAMHAFWQYGYEGTSMSTLMEVMGMNKASIYAAYGSKEDLFKKVLERYVAGPASFIASALAKPTAAAVVEDFLTQAARALTGEDQPAGCLVIQGALACSADAASVKCLLSGYRQAIETQLTQRFARAIAEGDLHASVDAGALAKLVMTVHQGMSVQAISGTSQAALESVGRLTTALIMQSSVREQAPARV